jgi:hypothetical protein
MDHFSIEKLFYDFVLIPAIQGLAYIKESLCPDPVIVPREDTLDILEGHLIDTDQTYEIQEKYLEGICTGMGVRELVNIITSAQEIDSDTIQGISLSFINNGDYITKEFPIETIITI